MHIYKQVYYNVLYYRKTEIVGKHMLAMWYWKKVRCCSVTKLCLTLRPHELQHSRLPRPSLSPGVCSDSRPLSQWCHPAISSSVVCLFSCPQSFLASGSFPMSQFFATGDQSIGTSASESVLPKTIQDWFLIDWFDLFVVQEILKSLIQHHNK